MVLKNYSKKEAVAIAVNGSRLYKNNFVGNKFLFVATNKHMKVESLEVVFPASSYMHLTGLICTHEDWTGLDFYNFCIDARLREEDIRIRKDGTTQQKLNILTSALSKQNLSASMLGNFSSQQPYLYTDVLVGGVKWAFGFIDPVGNGFYLPNTLLEGDIRKEVHEAHRIIATYVKRVESSKYEKLIYRASKIQLNRLVYPEDWGDRPRLVPPETGQSSSAASFHA